MIRAADRSDLPEIAALIRELAIYERLEREVVFDDAELASHLFGARPYAEVLLACDGDAVVGFALFFHNFSTFLGRPGIFLEDLFVRPQHRGRGHGLALLRELARVAVERGCGRVEWNVLDWNTDAIGFYRSIGARPVDGWTVYRLTGDALEDLGGTEDGKLSR